MRELTPRIDSVRPDDPMWRWPTAFIGTGIARLVELGRIDEARARAIHAAYESFAAVPGAFQVTPLVLEIVGIKRA